MGKKKKNREKLYIVFEVFATGNYIMGASSRRSAAEKMMKRRDDRRPAELVKVTYDRKTGRARQRTIKNSLQ